VVGTILYDNSGLTTRFTSVCTELRTGTCLPFGVDGSYSFDGFTLDGSGVVTSINQLVNCS
jgi:hypothetical protein